MATQPPPDNGPNGFIELSQNMLVVDRGKVFLDGKQVGVLFEDGLIQGMAAPFGSFNGLKSIEEIPGCVFRGIDRQGVVLEMPGPASGPTGVLKYNNVSLTVLYGRIATQEHKLLGGMDDSGKIYLRDHKNPSVLHEMDEQCQLGTSFQGITSAGKPLITSFTRPMHRSDRSYMDNEIMRYFEDYDKLNTVQKNYVLETMKLWAQAGILQVVRKSEGDAALANVKHGASGVTSIRSGKVNIDREEFETEIGLYRRYGAVAPLPTRYRPYYEVRINLVVSHEFGHQLEFSLSQAFQEKIEDLYHEHLERSSQNYHAPKDYEGASELLQMHQIEERVFVSGYCRASFHEYWAECVAAFSVPDGRRVLKDRDPAVYQMLHDIIFCPEKSMSVKFAREIVKLQTSLRAGGELSDTIL